jgi:hypothetical protein
MNNRGARYFSVALGLWLFVSAFLWRHSPAQFTNSLIVGFVSVVAALIALRVPAVRFINTAAGVWLVLGAYSLPRVTLGTAWNDMLVGTAILIASLVGPRTTTAAPRKVQRTP